MRGPKTDAAIRKRVDEVITQHGAEAWVTVEIKWDAVEKFKAITRGKPTADTIVRRIIQQVPAPACRHRRGKHRAIGGYGRDLPADNQYQGEARRSVQKKSTSTNPGSR